MMTGPFGTATAVAAAGTPAAGASVATTGDGCGGVSGCIFTAPKQTAAMAMMTTAARERSRVMARGEYQRGDRRAEKGERRAENRRGCSALCALPSALSLSPLRSPISQLPSISLTLSPNFNMLRALVNSFTRTSPNGRLGPFTARSETPKWPKSQSTESKSKSRREST